MVLKVGGLTFGQTEEGNSDNVIKLNNSDKISDLIVFTNNNDPTDEEYGIYSNLTMRFEDTYSIGYINSNFVITSNKNVNGIYDENDYMFSISSSNIGLKHSNINLDFHHSLNINNIDNLSDTTTNIINVNTEDNDINFNNYDIKINLNDNNKFIIINSDNDASLFNFNKTNASFHCDLIVDNLYTEHIYPINAANNVRIENFEIGKNVFNDINVGRNNYNEDITIESVTPLILNNNIYNHDSDNIIELRRFKHCSNNDLNIENYDTIIKFDNNGFINIGNCDDIYNEKNRNSYIYINDYDYDYVSSNINTNNNNNIDLLFNHKGNYDGDSFNINKYGNITIGSKNYNNSLLFINRNDDRLNLDIVNSNNINIDNPLLKLNINYNSSNNYLWYSTDRDDYYLQKIFTSVYFQNIPSVFESLQHEEDFYNSYKNNYCSNYANLDANLPTITLNDDNYPKLYYTIQGHRYYFLHAQQINTIIDYDYTKMNLQISDSCNLTVENENIYNILYNRLNLQLNENEIKYDYKVESWTNTIGDSSYKTNHIIYPSYILFKSDILANRRDFELQLLNITSSITIKQRTLVTGNLPQYLYQHFILIPINLPTTPETYLAGAPNISTESEVNGERDELVEYLANNDIFAYTPTEIKNFISSSTDNYFKKFTCIKHVVDSENIFAIHISKNVYNNFINFKQQFYNLESNIIPKPNFFEFSKNDLFTSAFTADGTLTFNNIDDLPITSNSAHGFSYEYSVYSKNKRGIFNKIETDIITSIDNKNTINFDKNNLSNIGQIYFNNTQLFNLDNLDVNNITNNISSNININNSTININPTFYGIKWENISITNTSASFKSLIISKATVFSTVDYNYEDITLTSTDLVTITDDVPINSFISVNINGNVLYFKQNIINNYTYYNEIINPDLKILLINKATHNNTKTYNLDDILLTSTEVNNININILVNSIIYIDISGTTYYFKQNNITNYSKNQHYDIYTEQHKYHNSIINIDTSKDNLIHPNISIYGNNPSFSLKSHINSKLQYFSTIKSAGFKNLAPFVGGSDDKKNIFEISYINDFDESFDTKFHNLNTRHILQHISDDYNMITLGENYNICIDNRGPENIKLSDPLFGTKWTNHGTSPRSFVGTEIINTILLGYLQSSDTLTLVEWTDLEIDNLMLTNYIIVNGNYYYPYSELHTDLLKNNSSNSTYKVSIGVPHNDTKINNTEYLYNYPRYFKDIVKNTDYMLNIYGSTKIYGIDGNTSAFCVNINDIKSSIDDNYKINVSIGTDIIADNDITTFNIGGNTYSDTLFYKDINNNTYINVSNIHSNVVFDITSNIFPIELAKSYIHTSNINNNFINDNGVLNINIIPNIPLDNLEIPDPPLRDIRITSYNEPLIDVNNTGTSNFITTFPTIYDNIYTIGDSTFPDNSLIDNDYNGNHYFKFLNQSVDNTITNYTIHVKDSIQCDVLIVGGGGGGGSITFGLRWVYIGNTEPSSGQKITNTALQNTFAGILEYKIFTLEDWNNYNIIITDDSYIEYDNGSTNNYFIPVKGGGGKGGQLIKLENIIIPANTDIELTIGNGGIGSALSGSIPTNGANSSFISLNNNSIAQGGNSIHNFYGEGDSGTLYIANWTYNIFNTSYPTTGQNGGNNKYFGGDGGSYQQLGGNGGGGGVDVQGRSRGDGGTGDALSNTGGGGGYGSAEWGNGAAGIILIKYKFIIKNEFINQIADIATLTNTYLEYNWIQGKWLLNEYVADTCNILINKLNDASDNLTIELGNSSNYTDYTSNMLYYHSSNLNINNSNYINTVNSNILYLNNDTSNYINNITTNISTLHTSNISNGELNIDRIPLIPFSKFSNLELATIFSPKINHNIAEFTSYYNCNIDYTSTYTDPEYCKYLILEYNDNFQTQQTSYLIEFRYDCKIDILLVGGGGGGGGTESINSGGGGGGGFIQAKYIDIVAGKSYNMKVGNGGTVITDGYNTEAFGIIAHGGKAGQSDGDDLTKGIGGIGGTYNIDSRFDEILGKIVTVNQGGNGGTSDRNPNVDNNNIKGNDGTSSDIFYNKTDGNNAYYWGGGGGASRWHNNGDMSTSEQNGIKYGTLPIGGNGGGGAGAIRSATISMETALGGDGYNNGESRNASSNPDILANSGGNGGKSTGGGGGGGFDIDENGYPNGIGGHGGSGIIIIKYYNINIPTEGNRLKGYLSYNYNSYNWEMNSLDLINLDIDVEFIDNNILSTSNQLVNYVQEQFNISGGVVNYSAVPLSFITNNSLANNAIGPENIIGYMGKTSNIDDTLTSAELIERGWVDGVGLIDLPSTAYDTPGDIYNQLLIKGNKFANNSITNVNIANNTITSDKFFGQISGDKLAFTSLSLSDISGMITNTINIINDSSSSLIDISYVSAANLDINILDFTGDKKIGGITYITSLDNLIKIPFNRLTDISIDIINIDITTNITGITKITSSTNSIPLSILENIEVNILDLENYGTTGFKLPSITLFGEIDDNYLTTIYLPSSNIDSTTLINTSVVLTGSEKIQPNIIANLNLSAEQIDTTVVGSYLQNVTLNFDQSKLDPSVLADIQVRPEDIAFKENSLTVNINTSYIPSGLVWIFIGNTEPSYGRKLSGYSLLESAIQNTNKTTFTIAEWNVFGITDLRHNDYIEIINSTVSDYFIPQRGLLNPATINDIILNPTDLDTFEDQFTWKLSNVSINTDSVKLNPAFLSNIYLKPDDLDQTKDEDGIYINKLQHVAIDTTIIKLDPALIGDLIITPDQLNTANALSSVTLATPIPEQSIDPLLINPNSIIINSSKLKTGFIDPNNHALGRHQFVNAPSMFNFAANSIDPTLIPDNIPIQGEMLIINDPTKKLQNINITGTVDTAVIGDGVTLTNTASITSTTGAKINTVEINAGSVDVSLINNATITASATLTSTGGAKIGGRAYIYGDIPIHFINDVTIDVDGLATTITTSPGNTHFAGVSTIYGSIDASFINNPLLQIDGITTSLVPDSIFSGDVTVSGVINANHIASPVTLQLVDGGSLNGSDITDATITASKLTPALSLNVSTITFADSSIMSSAVSEDILTAAQISTAYISKETYKGYFNKPAINNIFNINLFNTTTDLWNILETPLYIYDTSKISISTFLPFSSFIDDEAIITINSKNNNSKIIISSYYTSDYGIGNIGIKENYNSTHGGSCINIGNSRLSIIVNPTGIANTAYNVMEFSQNANYSHSELHVPKLVFNDGTNMTTASFTLLDSNKQLIMNNAISNYTYNDASATGEGFIHCNGLHAQFDITAYSTTTQSDERLKKEIKTIEYNDELLKLNAVSFKWIDENKSNTSNVGFIAQEIEKVLPNLVKDGVDNYKSVNYIGLIPYLVKHIQKLEKRIEILENKI